MKDFTLDGFITKNIDVRQTSSGAVVTKFSINSPNYNRETQQSVPQFFECEYWHSAEPDFRAQNILEGALVLVRGSLSFQTWQDQQTNQNKSKVVLKVRDIGIVRPPQPKPQGAYQAQSQAYGQTYQQPQYAPQRASQAHYPAQQAYQKPRQYQQTRQAPQVPRQVTPAPAQPAQPPAQPAPQQAKIAQVSNTVPAQPVAYDEDIPF